MFGRFVCHSIQKSLPDYVTHRHSSAEREGIERHLAVCPKCAVLHHQLRQAVDLAEQARNAPLPTTATSWDDLRARLEAAPAPASCSARRFTPIFVGGAVALALATLLCWIALDKKRPIAAHIGSHPFPSSTASAPPEMQTSEPPHIAALKVSPGNPLPAPRRRALVTALHTQASFRNSIPRASSGHPPAPPLTLAEESAAASGMLPIAEPRKREVVAERMVKLQRMSLQQEIEAAGKPALKQVAPVLRTQAKLPGVALLTARAASKPSDELAFLNPDPDTSLNPWTQRPADEIHRLEALLQRDVKQGDHFVTVPLPRIAGEGPSAVKAAVTAHQKEVSIVDARLVREIALRMKAVSFADLCQHLMKETGVQFTANRRVADDKVTLLCHPRSLRSIMRMIAQHFGFAWVRKGEEGAYEYELTQTLKSQLLEEGLRSKDQEEMLLAIDRSMERFRKYRGMSLDQINALKTTKDNFGDLFQLQMGGLVPMNLFFGLSQTEMDTLRTGRPFTINLMGRDAAFLPSDVTQGIWHSFDESYNRERKFAQEHGSEAHVPDHPSRLTASLRLDRSKPGEFALKGNLSDDQTGLEPSLAVATSPAFTVENAKTNAKLAADPDLQQIISLKPVATCHFDSTPYPDTEALYEKAGDKVTTADVLEKLFDAMGIDIVGDYFSHLQDPSAVTVRNVRLFSALNQLGDAMRMRWTKMGAKQDAWLQFRTSTFYYDRPQEISNRLLERWKTLRKKQGVLNLEDLTEIGQLPDAQLDSVWMAQAAIAVYGLEEWQMGRNAQLRPHWRFLGSLSDAQRREIWTEKGLSYSDLSAELQNQFLALAYDGDADRPGRHQVRGGNLRVLYAFATHPLQYGGSYAVLQSNPLLFIYSDTTADAPNRMAIVGPWNAIYGMRPEMLHPDAFSILPGRQRL